MTNYREPFMHYDSGLEADDEADVKFASILNTNMNSLVLAKRAFLENINNNNKPLTRPKELDPLGLDASATVAINNDTPIPNSKPQRNNTSYHLDGQHQAPSPKERNSINENCQDRKRNDNSAKTRLLSLIQDLYEDKIQKPEENNVFVTSQQGANQEVNCQLSNRDSVKASNKTKLSNSKSKSKHRHRRNHHRKSHVFPIDQVLPSHTIEAQPISSKHASNIMTNMSITHHPHSWGQLKLIQAHLPPWKNVDPTSKEDEEEEEEIPKPKKFVVFSYPTVLEYSNSKSFGPSRTLPQNQARHFSHQSSKLEESRPSRNLTRTEQQQSYNFSPRSPWPVVPKRRDVDVRPAPTVVVHFQEISKPSGSRPQVHHKRPVPLPPCTVDGSNIPASHLSNKKSSIMVKRKYPRPWALPVILKETNSIKVRKEFEDKNAMARRILETMWQKEDEKRVADLTEEDNSINPLEALKNISSEVAMIDRLLKEIGGNKDLSTASEQKNNILQEKPNQLSHMSITKSQKSRATGDRSKICNPQASYDDKPLDNSHYVNQHLSSTSHYIVPLVNPQQLPKPVFDSDFDLPDVLKPNFEYLFQADLRKFQTKNSKSEFVNNSDGGGQQTDSMDASSGNQNADENPSQLRNSLGSLFEREREMIHEPRPAGPKESYIVPVGQRAIDRFFPNNHANALQSSVLTPLEPQYIPPPHIEQRMVERFFTSTTTSRTQKRLDRDESYTINTEIRCNDRNSLRNRSHNIAEQNPINSEQNEGQKDGDDVEVESSESDSTLDASWTMLPTPSDHMLLKTHEATEEWIGKMAKINNTNEVPDVYPIIKTLFACSGMQQQGTCQGDEQKSKEEQEQEITPNVEQLLHVVPMEMEEVVRVSNPPVANDKLPEINNGANPQKTNVESKGSPVKTKPVPKSTPKPQTKTPAPKHIKPWNAATKPAKREPYVPPSPKPKVQPSPAQRTKKQLAGGEPKNKHPQVSKTANQGHSQRSNLPFPTAQFPISRSLLLQSVKDAYDEFTKQYRIQEFVNKAARTKTISQVLRGRVLSAPPDLHLDFSSSLIDIRVPTAKDFNQGLRGCKSFFF